MAFFYAIYDDVLPMFSFCRKHQKNESENIFSLSFFNIQEIYLVEHKLDIVALKGCNDSGSAPVPVNHIKKYVKYVRTIKSK